MRPLLFLTTRSFLNGIKRALGSPTRFLGIILFAGYYFMMFVRPAMMTGQGGRGFSAPPNIQFDFPPLATINAVVFGIFAVLSIFMMMGGIVQQGGFKAADVDMLFPTPLSPRLVLLFRMVRDYLITLLMPLFFLLIGLMPAKAGWEALFRDLPNKEYAPLVFRTAMIGWILMALCWVVINNALSLYVNRSDLEGDRNRRLLGWSMGLLLIGSTSYIAFRLNQSHSLSEMFQVAFAPGLRIVFFSASFATMITMAPLDGSLLEALIGGGSLLAIVACGIALAMRQAGWMYDQAAIRGQASAGFRQAQRQGDVMLASAEQVRSGKAKVRRIRWLDRMWAPGPWALIWKDAYLQFRGMLWIILLVFGLGLFMTLMPILVPDKDDKTPMGMLFLMMQGVSLFTCTISLANAGYLELLRRVDLQKPLPFRPSATVLFEVGSKSLLGTAVTWIASTACLVFKPALWPEALGAAIFAPALSLLMSAVVFLVIILFPDMDDQAQRQFRGMLMMLALAVLTLPAVAVFAGLLIVHVSPPLAAAAGAAVCSAVCWVVVSVAGRLYAEFNPSE